MEEILASIRRIISEDEAPAAAAAAPEPVHEPEPEPVHEPAAFTSVEDDVLELTDRLDEPAHEPEPEPSLETLGDLDVFSAAAAAPSPRQSSDRHHGGLRLRSTAASSLDAR
jgi:cell pole-organizing protein PopZ